MLLASPLPEITQFQECGEKMTTGYSQCVILRQVTLHAKVELSVSLYNYVQRIVSYGWVLNRPEESHLSMVSPLRTHHLLLSMHLNFILTHPIQLTYRILLSIVTCPRLYVNFQISIQKLQVVALVLRHHTYKTPKNQKCLSPIIRPKTYPCFLKPDRPNLNPTTLAILWGTSGLTNFSCKSSATTSVFRQNNVLFYKEMAINVFCRWISM